MADRPDGFDFVKDGTILCFIDNEQWKLRRPKTGEFKQLRLAVRARDDELAKLRGDTKVVTPVDPEKPTNDEAAELLEQIRVGTRDLTDRQEDLDREWMSQVFETLADRPLPEDRDDWPVWLWQADNVSKLLDHWRQVPLARGPQ